MYEDNSAVDNKLPMLSFCVSKALYQKTHY